MTPLTFRKIGFTDVPAWSALAERTFRAAFAPIYPEPNLSQIIQGSYNLPKLRAEIEDPQTSVWFAEQNGAPLGYLQLEQDRGIAGVTTPRPMWLHRIYVDGTATGQGIGGQLMEKALEEARISGATALWLTVWDLNPAAVRFYRRWGFRKTGYVPFPIDSDEPPSDYLMQCDLGDIQVLPYTPQYRGHFSELNLAWIKSLFAVEPKDQETLGDPETHILDKGGEIFFLRFQGEVVGTCAVIPHEKGVFELGKMAITPQVQGKGLGHYLMEAAIAHARAERAERMILDTNAKLIPAIRLYEKFGFRTTRLGVHGTYNRADVEMALDLNK